MLWSIKLVLYVSLPILCVCFPDQWDNLDNNVQPVNETVNQNFNFNSGSNGNDDLWNNGHDVPVVSWPGAGGAIDLVVKDHEKETFCHPDYCQVVNPCNSTSKCLNSVACNKTICQSLVKKNKTSNSDNKSDFPENNCANVTGALCTDPNYCIDLINCECKPGYTGSMCTHKCVIACVPDQGICLLGSNMTHSKFEYCNCLHNWEGDLCDRPVADVKVAESRARKKEEDARMMAGILAGAIVVALCAAIAAPIVLWRMRVIFVLKFIYYFKPYEDEDGKMFDAYISMSSTSAAESFVFKQLCPKLESQGFKLYLQARDNSPGEVQSEGILEAVEKSRCTIMIVTKDYINNEWNRFEYLIAQHETVKLKQKIIPIILEKLEKSTNMDKALKHILDSVKCLKYPLKISDDQSNCYILQPVNVTSLSTNKDSHKTFSIPESQPAKIFKAEEKFWKCLELTMPKKKKQKKKSVDSSTEIFNSSNKNIYCENHPQILDKKSNETLYTNTCFSEI